MFVIEMKPMRFILFTAALFFSIGIIMSFSKAKPEEVKEKNSFRKELSSMEKPVQSIEQTIPEVYEIDVNFEQ